MSLSYHGCNRLDNAVPRELLIVPDGHPDSKLEYSQILTAEMIRDIAAHLFTLLVRFVKVGRKNLTGNIFKASFCCLVCEGDWRKSLNKPAV